MFTFVYELIKFEIDFYDLTIIFAGNSYVSS